MHESPAIPVFQRPNITKSISSANQADQGIKVMRIAKEDFPFDCQIYNRPGLYKISIHHGHNKVFYDDKVFEFKDYAILFSRPNMTYRFEHIGVQECAFFCVFPSEFFDQFVNIASYPLFDPERSPFMQLSADQMEFFTNVFLEMEKEVTLDFSFKNDSLRNQIFQMILNALKLSPAAMTLVRDSNGAFRLLNVFRVLLEKQFPIENSSQQMSLRHPVEFAKALSVHVNHLNKSLKLLTGRTTTQLISYRMAKEAKNLLLNTDWNINEIAWCLGFEDRTHFIKFFKKNVNTTPTSFRKSMPI